MPPVRPLQPLLLPGPPPLVLRCVPCLEDNFAYLLSAPGGETWCVDAPEAGPILDALHSHGLTLTRLLVTHTHTDHVAGLRDVVHATGCAVSGPPGLGGNSLGEGDALEFAGGPVRVMDTSGHSPLDLSYLVSGPGVCFCGDTVFAGGCGRLFAGPPSRMWRSIRRLRDLPDDTLLCCGHDYALDNLAFAVETFPCVPAFAERLKEVKRLKSETLALMPVSVGDESRANPMWMADHPEIASALGMDGAAPADVFARVREMRNLF